MGWAARSWPWRLLSGQHRRWIAVNALLVTALVNTGVNAAVAWASVRGGERVPLWSLGETSMLGDTLGTLFVLPLITCVLCTTAVWRDLRAGRLERVVGLGRRPLLAALPPTRLLRGMAFGVLCFALLAAPVTIGLVASGVGDVGTGEFIAYKTAFAVTLGAVVTPVIALRAMADRLG